MKILFSIRGYFPPRGGAEWYVFHLSSQLGKAGHSPRILTFSLPGDTMPFARRIVWPGWNIRKLFRFFLVVLSEVRAADVVYANYSDGFSVAVSAVALIARRPIFNFAHGNGIFIPDDAGIFRRFVRFLTLHFASGVVATSEEIATVVRRYAARVTVATAIDVAGIRAGVSPGRVAAIRASFPGYPRIVAVRRLVEKNGIQYLIAAMPEIVRFMPDAVCMIVGAGPLEADLRRLASVSGYGDRIRFCGERLQSELYAHIAAADVVVFPSSAEARSLACLEAMALARPTVVSAVGGLLELAGDDNKHAVTVSLFDRSDSRYDAPPLDRMDPAAYVRFGRAIATAIDSDSNAARVRAAERFVETQYDWPVVARNIMSFSGIEPFFSD